MRAENPFKWRHFEGELILLCVRWYLRYALSYRDLEEMMRERGVMVDHTTVYRRVQHYAPELDKRCRSLLGSTNDSYRADETHIRVKGQWKYLYRAVDSEGNTLAVSGETSSPRIDSLPRRSGWRPEHRPWWALFGRRAFLQQSRRAVRLGLFDGCQFNAQGTR